MAVIDSVNQIFDKVHITEQKESWTVDESSKEALFKHLTLSNKNGKFYIIDNLDYKGWKVLTESKSSFLKDCDCDGVAFTFLEGDQYFLLSELKTNLSSEKVHHAIEQLIYTYIKLCMPLSICGGFDSEKYSLIGLIACKPPKDEAQETKLKDRLMLMTQGLLSERNDMKCLLKLYFEKKIKVKLGKVSFLDGKPLNNYIKDRQITIYLKTGDNYDSDNASFDLQTELV